MLWQRAKKKKKEKKSVPISKLKIQPNSPVQLGMITVWLTVYVSKTEYLSDMKLAHELNRLIRRERFPFDPNVSRNQR